eukprot:2108824-Amphidinium_carterae.2
MPRTSLLSDKSSRRKNCMRRTKRMSWRPGCATALRNASSFTCFHPPVSDARLNVRFRTLIYVLVNCLMCCCDKKGVECTSFSKWTKHNVWTVDRTRAAYLYLLFMVEVGGSVFTKVEVVVGDGNGLVVREVQ